MQPDIDLRIFRGCQGGGHFFSVQVIFLPSLPSWVTLPLSPCIPHYDMCIHQGHAQCKVKYFIENHAEH